MTTCISMLILLFHHLLGELMMNDKSLKIWKILMRFLDLPPWANRSKGLEFTGILLTSFFFVRKHRQQMSGLLLSKRYWMTKVWKSEKIWWDFLTCHLEQIVLRGLNFTGILLTSFFFVRKQTTNERTALILMILNDKSLKIFDEISGHTLSKLF